jgi:hypothetical protein
MVTTPLWPARTSEIADSSRVSSSTRPTKGMSHRNGRVAAADAPVTSHGISVCCRPRSWVTPKGSRVIAGEHSASVAAPINTPSGGASAWSRDAVLTTSPIAV